MSLVTIFAALVVILKGMERASDVALDLKQVLTIGSGRGRIDHRAIGVGEPFSDVYADRRVPGRLVYDECRIELHLQLRANRRAEHERISVKGALDAHAFPDQVGVGGVE